MRYLLILLVILSSCAAPKYGSTRYDAYAKSKKVMKRVVRKQKKRHKHGNPCPSFSQNEQTIN